MQLRKGPRSCGHGVLQAGLGVTGCRNRHWVLKLLRTSLLCLSSAVRGGPLLPRREGKVGVEMGMGIGMGGGWPRSADERWGSTGSWRPSRGREKRRASAGLAETEFLHGEKERREGEGRRLLVSMIEIYWAREDQGRGCMCWQAFLRGFECTCSHPAEETPPEL